MAVSAAGRSRPEMARFLLFPFRGTKTMRNRRRTAASPPTCRPRIGRLVRATLFLGMAAAAGISAAQAEVATGRASSFEASRIAGEILVWFDDSVRPAEARRRLEALGAVAVEARYTPGLYRVVLRGSDRDRPGLRSRTLESRTAAVLEQIATLPGLRGAEPHLRGSGGFTPDDPLVGRQWHLGSPHGVETGVRKAWNRTRGSSKVTIAMLDSGLLLDHPEFEGRVARNPAEYPPNGVDDDGNGLIDDFQGWDFVDNDNEPWDENGHGTWTAAVLAANAGNEFGVAGVDHASRLLILRVLGPDNRGSTADVIDALTYVSRRSDVDLVNLSLVRFPPSKLLGEAIRRAARTATLVACAGNDGPGTADAMYPGAHPDTISVGATDRQDFRAPFSSTGSTLSLVAPGRSIEVPAIDFPYRGDASVSVSGCSFAVPIVTGISALLLSYDQTLDRIELETYLAGSAADLGEPGWDPEFGWGRVSAQGALKLLLVDRPELPAIPGSR